jgi:hypothetical protein
MILEVTHDLDEEGNSIVLVPLTNSDQSAVLYQEDFNSLIDKGLDPRWRISNGQIIERGKGRVSIARLIADAGKGDKVQYKDRNPCNLKRDNLVTAAGGGRQVTRDKLLPANRPHSFLRNVELKSTEKVVPWQSELAS